MNALVERLDVGIHSRGLCPACLSFVAVAMDHGDEREVARETTQAASLMWDEGLGETVRTALIAEAGRGDVEARAALRELDSRRERSGVFRAVVRRLADALREEVRRRETASLN
jgi:hypothetical protein